LVIGDNDLPPYDIPMAALSYDAASATLLGMAPDGFVADGHAIVEARTVVLGTIDSTPDQTSNEELLQLVVLELGDDAITTRGSIAHTGWEDRAVLGNHVIVPTLDEGLEVWSLPDLHLEGSITIPGACRLCSVRYVRTDAGLIVAAQHNKTLTLVA